MLVVPLSGRLDCTGVGDVTDEGGAHHLSVGHCGHDGFVPESYLVLLSLCYSHYGSLGDWR